jgi:hypothetical protein
MTKRPLIHDNTYVILDPTLLITWIGQIISRAADHRVCASNNRANNLARREDLVRDFVIEASETYGDALVNSEPKTPEIVDLYAMVSRLRGLGMVRSVACAETVMTAILDTYFAPNRSIADIREFLNSGAQEMDPLKNFADPARQELRPFVTR